MAVEAVHIEAVEPYATGAIRPTGALSTSQPAAATSPTIRQPTRTTPTQCCKL